MIITIMVNGEWCCHHFSPTNHLLIEKITDRSFRYASPCLWKKLPDPFRRPCQSCFDSPPHSLVSTQLISVIIATLIIHHASTLSLPAQTCLTYLFNTSSTHWTAFMNHDHGTRPDLSCFSIYFYFVFLIFFV